MSDIEQAVGPVLAKAMTDRGFTSLTAVQEAVLDPSLEGRDLRISSQTGSGKTVAIGLAIRDVVGKGSAPRPRALVVEPTRELAKQVEEELGWLFAPLGVKVASVTGGASYRDERRALSAGPAVIVGTPGRLLDHLTRGGIEGTDLGAVILDEADRLLDMGFRDDLDAIMSHAPEGRRTHLVSATFAREVKSLADRVQADPVHVEGTRLGAANVDIEHVVHLVEGRQRVDALVNLLLSDPEAQTLVFARTRADVANITTELEQAGFTARALSGEMQQRERNRALEAFKRGDLHVLVATDVAARGIDVQDIVRVIHVEPPTDADTYTHRSGRTGRAGRKGKSIVLTPPVALARTQRLLRSLGIRSQFEPVPTPETIRAARTDRIFADLTGPDPEGFAGHDDQLWGLAKRLAEKDPAKVIARLLLRAKIGGVAEPRVVRVIPPPGEERSREQRPPISREKGNWVAFRVSWGREKGADPRRLLALACRRGDIVGREVGAIAIARNHAIVEVAATVADHFEEAASKPDARDRVTIVRERIQEERGAERGGDRPPPRRDERPRDERPRDDRPHGPPPRRIEEAPVARPGSRPVRRPDAAAEVSPAATRESPRSPDRRVSPDRRPATPERPFRRDRRGK
ncbi:MAG: DEAD/DEAH box helicase [Polyangiales bacterium]